MVPIKAKSDVFEAMGPPAPPAVDAVAPAPAPERLILHHHLHLLDHPHQLALVLDCLDALGLSLESGGSCLLPSWTRTLMMTLRMQI